MSTRNHVNITPTGTRSRKPIKIYQDDIKTQYTSHWDWDYLPRDEVARLSASGRNDAPARAEVISDPAPSIRPLLLGALGAAVAATLSGLLLIAG